MIKITHKINNYEHINEYSVICYLAHITRNNFDKDFYIFKLYPEKNPEILEIDRSKNNIKVDTETKTFTYEFEDEKWELAVEDEKKFRKWIEQLKKGTIKELLKLQEFKNLNEIYKSSNIARKIREAYNKVNVIQYTIEKFFKLIKSLVKVEMINKDKKEIKRVGKRTNIKDISIRIVGSLFETVKEKVTKVSNNIVNNAFPSKTTATTAIEENLTLINYIK